MAQTVTVEFQVAQVIPNAGHQESDWIIATWNDLQKVVTDVAFRVEDPYRAELDDFRVSLDAMPVLQRLITARRERDSFAQYLQAAHAAHLETDATLTLTLTSQDAALERYTLYHGVGVFIQQVMLALNIALPGSCHLVGTRFVGADAALIEAPEFHSAMFTNGWLSAFDADWPQLKPLPIEQVWRWLDACATSEADTALKPVNKVLFGVLEIAQQQRYFGSRDVLLVSHMLEILMGMDDADNPGRLRERIAAVLGSPSTRAGSFTELYRMKHAMIRGDHPIKRPPIVIHDADEEILQQLEQHNSPLEQAMAIVLALLQDLVSANAAGYRYTEQVHRLTM